MKHIFWLGPLAALGSNAVLGCNLEIELARSSKRIALLDAASRLAERSDCQVVLADGLALNSGPVSLAGGVRIAEALDQLSAEHGLNWTQRGDGIIEIVASDDQRAQSLRTATLRIDATAVTDATVPTSIIEQLLLPSERGPLIARSEVGEARVDDEAIRDYSTAVMRAPGVYTMANTDVIRGISTTRLPAIQRASLITIDGIPLPAEASQFNQYNFGLLRSLQVTRTGTGLATTFGAGAGDIALATADPDSAWTIGMQAGSADRLAPRVAATMTWDFGVPGLRTAFGASQQTEPEDFDDKQQPNLYTDTERSARLSWQSPGGRHLLLGSFVDFANANLGGAEMRGSCGAPLCPAGAEIEMSGGAVSWLWQADDALRLVAAAGVSDTRVMTAMLRNGEARPSLLPIVVQLRHVDLRADYTINQAFSASLGVNANRRERDSFSQSRIDLTVNGGPDLGVDAAGPGTAFVQWRTVNTRRVELPQAYAELRYDDGERWDGHIGARVLDSDVGIYRDTRDYSEVNCAVEPDLAGEGVETCAAALTERFGLASSAVHRAETTLLPTLSARRRFSDSHWLGAQWRSGFIVADVLAAAYNPRSAIETVDTVELVWHREFLDAHLLEARAFRHHWDDRFTLTPNATASFSTNVVGLELEYRWQPDDNVELWANAAVLRGRQSDRSLTPGADGGLVGAPKRSGGVGGRYRFDNGFYLGGNLTHADPAYATDGRGEFLQLPSRDLLDARIGFRQQHVDVSIWGTNLLDDDYVIDELGTSNNRNAYHAYDRVVGIDVSVSF